MILLRMFEYYHPRSWTLANNIQARSIPYQPILLGCCDYFLKNQIMWKLMNAFTKIKGPEKCIFFYFWWVSVLERKKKFWPIIFKAVPCLRRCIIPSSFSFSSQAWRWLCFKKTNKQKKQLFFTLRPSKNLITLLHNLPSLHILCSPSLPLSLSYI